MDVFIVGHTAPERTRKEMVDWLKTNFPKVKIVALIPSANHQLPRVDYNVVVNDVDVVASSRRKLKHNGHQRRLE